MKETKILFLNDVPIPEDKEGNIYTHADMGIDSILESFDIELKQYGLELLSGDAGSSDYFFCVVKREGEGMEKERNHFTCFTDEELEAELNRRKGPPQPLASEDVNLTSLSNAAADYLLEIHTNGRPPKDGEHYIFERVMETFYGSDIFFWIHEHNTSGF